MREAVGIQFDVDDTEAAATARVLGAAGVRRARLEIPWTIMSYDDPSRLTDAAAQSVRTRLLALQANGIRPLILLNGNQGLPCPVQHLRVQAPDPALKGSTSI